MQSKTPIYIKLNKKKFLSKKNYADFKKWNKKFGTIETVKYSGDMHSRLTFEKENL